MDIDSTNDTQAAVQGGTADGDEERRKRSGAILTAVVVAFIVLWWILTQTTVVPDLTGLPEVQARHALRDASLKAGVVTEVRSRKQRVGTVADQAPYGGIRVMKGSDIDFALAVRPGDGGATDGGGEQGPPLFGFSLSGDQVDSGSTLQEPGQPRATYLAQGVPMVQGMSEAKAVDVLRGAGYRVRVKRGPVTTGPSRGKVSYQDPEPDAIEPAGTVVEIWVSTGGPGAVGFPYPSPFPLTP